MTHLTLAFLGPPEIRHGDRLLTFPTRKTLALLAYLAVEGGLQPREKLATLFWPESTHKAGRASLRTTLAMLRKELTHADAAEAVPHLRVEREAIGFNPDASYELDLKAVQRAEQEPTLAALQTAVTLMRGEFLEGFSLPDAPRFDEWLSFQQQRWHLSLGRCLDRLTELQTERGETTAAIATLNRWLAFNPLEERAYRCLMQAHAAAGNRTGALQVYEKCASVLMAELGVEPTPETSALAARIRAQEVPGLGDVLGPKRDTARRSSDVDPRLTLPLVGRAEEHAQLVAAYHHARESRFRTVVIRGQAGIGKTRLARHFLSWAAAQGATVLRGRAFETGGRLPYQPLTAALRSATLGEVDLSPTWLAELGRLLPELCEAHPDLPPPTRDEAMARTRLFEAVARLGQSLCIRAPLVLFIDDVQWADAASLDLLQYAARHWHRAAAPIMVLLSLRSEALARADSGLRDASLQQWLSSLGRDLPLTRLTLGPLREADTRQLVASLGITDARLEPVVTWLFAETGGQPFYLSETIEALVDEGIFVWRRDEGGGVRLEVTADVVAAELPLPPGFVPPGVREVLLGRLARLSSTAFRLLAAGAVLGQAFGYRQLCRVSGVPAKEGLEALDELLTSHLLAEAETAEERPYLFAHDKIRDVVYTEAGDARRRLFHERAYRMLDEVGAAAAQIAHHALAAGLVEPAFSYALAAGDDAMDLFAVRDAVEQYERARTLLQENPPLKEEVDPAGVQHLYRRLGRGYELLDEWDKAQEIEEEMLTLADELPLASMKVTALNRLAAVAIQSRLDVEEAAELLQKAVTVAEAHGDEAGLAETEWNLAQTCFHRRDREGAIRHGERALQLAQSLERPKLVARSHNILSYAKTGPAPLDRLGEARAHAAAGRDFYGQVGNRAMEVDCLNMLGAIDLHSGRPGVAEERLRQARAVSVEIGNAWGQANTAFNLAQALLERGRYGEALAKAEKSVAAARLGEPTPLVAGTLSVRGGVYRALLALDDALDDHVAARRIFTSTPNPHIAHMMAADLCADYALAGEWEKAYRYARQAITYDRADAWLFSGFYEWLLVAALLRGGDEASARQMVQQFGDLIGDNPRYQVPYRRALAELATHDGDLARAVAHLEAALAHAEQIGLPGEQWPILAELAELAKERGDRETAAALRRQAREIIHFIADQVDDAGLREGFLDRSAVRALLSS